MLEGPFFKLSKRPVMKRLVLILTLATLCWQPLWADQGMTSELHSQNAGKIVFSTSEIKFRKENPSQLATEFRLSEPLYARVYMTKALRNNQFFINGTPVPLSSPETHQTIKMFIDGKRQEYRFGEFLAHDIIGDKAAAHWTTWQMNLNPTDRSLGERYVMEAWSKLTAKLAPGRHKIRFEVWGQQGQAITANPVSTGEFTLLVDEGDMAGAAEFPVDSYTGSDLTSIKQAMKDAMVGRGVTTKPDEVVDISVTSEWREGIYTDSKNRYRKIQGTVLWKDTDGDGLSRFTSYSFLQDWTGSGWSALKFNAFVNGGPEGEAKAR